MMMGSIIFISSDDNVRLSAINRYLEKQNLKIGHHDVLFFDNEAKLGVEQVKKIREYLSIKPYNSDKKGVVLQSANNLTIDAQNALLKTLEEHPGYVFLILGVEKESDLIDTVRSRCEVINFQFPISNFQFPIFSDDIGKLNHSSIEERFEYVEKLEDKDRFLEEMVYYWRGEIGSKPEVNEYVKDLLLALEWKNQNVNVRAILEYIMLKMPG